MINESRDELMDSEIDNNELYEEESVRIISKNGFFKRAFRRMEVDSLRAAVFVLILSSMGTSLFTMHHLFDECGILIGSLLLCLIILNFNFSCQIVIEAFKNSLGAKTFTDLIEINLGKLGRILYNIIFGIFLILVVVSINLSISKIIYYNISGFYNQVNGEPLPMEMEVFVRFCIIGVSFSLFVLVIQKNLDFLGNLTAISFLFFVINVIVSTFQAPVYYEKNIENNEMEINYYNTNLQSIFNNGGILVCSFNALISFFTVTNTVRNPSNRRLKKIFRRTYYILAGFYLFGALIGYYTLGNKSKNTDLFIFREKYGTTDNIMIFSRFLTMFSILVGGALCLFPLKIIIAGSHQIEAKKNILITLFLVVLCGSFAAVFQNVSKFLSIAGNFSGSFIGFIFPGLLGIKNNYFKTTHGRIFLYIWTALMALYCLSSTIVGIIHFNDSS